MGTGPLKSSTTTKVPYVMADHGDDDFFQQLVFVVAPKFG
jgi:hypothetical protein